MRELQCLLYPQCKYCIYKKRIGKNICKYLREVKGLRFISIGLEEWVIGKADRADTTGWLVQCDVVPKGQNSSNMTK